MAMDAYFQQNLTTNSKYSSLLKLIKHCMIDKKNLFEFEDPSIDT